LILSIVNQKGGVGKSTTAINMGAGLAILGKDVLLVDLDPQSNTTSALLQRHIKDGFTVYDILDDWKLTPKAVVDTGISRLKIIPSNIELAGAEIELVSAISREMRLKKALDPIKNDFDFILIDCPPSLSLLTLNALTASDGVIIPIQCEYFALEGLSKLLDTLSLVKENLNENLEIFGVLLTMYDNRTRLSAEVAEEVREYFGDKVFKTVIPRSVRLSEAPGFGKPIQEFAPNSKGALAYNELAREVIENAKEKLG
jgi:chromosome partitioning protein